MAEIKGSLWVVHAFQKKSKSGIETPKSDIDLVKTRLVQLRRELFAMNEELELVHGSGNVFRDLDDPDADLKQAKAVLAARIIAALDRTGPTVSARPAT